MRSTQQFSITLPLEMARMVQDKVKNGGYASESEVIREGLRALRERDAIVERWLTEDVAPAHDAHRANPARARPLAEASQRLENLMSIEVSQSR
jgi:antitoxin ParD1/3/4